MKTTRKTLGWLVGAAARKAVGGAMMAAARKAVGGAMMAVALAMGMTGCSSEDTIADEPTPQEPTAQTAGTIHVTVGAGISDGEGQTRSTVDYSGGTRTLTFTEGDKLYVRAVVARDDEKDYDAKILCGWLTIDGTTISGDGKSADFSGDLEELDADYAGTYGRVNGYHATQSPHVFTTVDPLAECVSATAMLVHSGTESSIFVDTGGANADYYEADYSNTHYFATRVFNMMYPHFA